MKYKYALTIEDTTNDQEILIIKGTCATKNKETCLKSIRREITGTIRDFLEHSNNQDTRGGDGER